MRLTNRVFESTGVIPPLVFWDDFFPEDSLSAISEFCEKQELEPGKIENSVTDETIRKSKIKFIDWNNDTDWIFSQFNHMVDFFNNEFYRFNLTGYNFFQYTVYNDSCHYGYHTDISSEPNLSMRKLSFSLILSDPSEYKGGEMEFLVEGKPIIPEQKKGRILAFPSYVLHKVNPITEGVRKSIVIWALGPRFV